MAKKKKVSSRPEICLENYLSLCTPFQFAPPYEEFTADPDSYRGPKDPQSVLKKLLKIHNLEDLIAAGLASLDAAGQPQLRDCLNAAKIPLIVLRHVDSGVPQNLVTPQGCLNGDSCALFHVLNDRFSVNALKVEHNRLFMTGGVEDAVILRSLGWAAMPIMGFEDISDPWAILPQFGVVLRTNPKSELTPNLKAEEPNIGISVENKSEDSAPPQQTDDLQPGAEDGAIEEESDGTPHLTWVRWSVANADAAEPPAIQSAVLYLRNIHRSQPLQRTWLFESTIVQEEINLLKSPGVGQTHFYSIRNVLSEVVRDSGEILDFLPPAASTFDEPRYEAPPCMVTANRALEEAIHKGSRENPDWDVIFAAMNAYRLAVSETILRLFRFPVPA